MAKVPATQLSLEYLRKQGMQVDIVERHIPSYPFPKKHDLFNLFDLVAIDRQGVYFIQTTSKTNRASRRKKMEAEADTLHLLSSIGPTVSVVLHSWAKPTKGGVKTGSYEIMVEEMADIEFGPDQKDHVTMREVAHPSMKQVREDWRRKNPTR